GSQSEGRTGGADSVGSGESDGGRRGLPGGRRYSRTMPEPTTDPTPAPTPHQESKHDRIVWIDCEMTGLDTTNDALVEIAALVTDSELNILGEGVDIVIHAPDAKLEAMVPVVREMHANSGLTDEIRSSSVTVAEAEKAVLDYVREWVPVAGSAPLAGNSIATDRGFLARDMPDLDAHLHYRMIDVSSTKNLGRRWSQAFATNSPIRGWTLAHHRSTRIPSRNCASGGTHASTTTSPRRACPIAPWRTSRSRSASCSSTGPPRLSPNRARRPTRSRPRRPHCRSPTEHAGTR